MFFPAYNDGGTIASLVILAVQTAARLTPDFEVIVVNDASTDGTSTELAQAHARWPQCRELRLPRNRGQATALLLGLHAARAPVIATLAWPKISETTLSGTPAEFARFR